MFEIQDAQAKVTNVVPKPNGDDLSVDITITTEAMDGQKVLKQLHARALAATCWDSAGEPTVDDFDIRGRHKIEHCAVSLTRNARTVNIDACDISHMKLRPTSKRRLEISFKVCAPVSSADVASLCDMWVDEEAQLTVREKQMSLDDVA